MYCHHFPGKNVPADVIRTRYANNRKLSGMRGINKLHRSDNRERDYPEVYGLIHEGGHDT